MPAPSLPETLTLRAGAYQALALGYAYPADDQRGRLQALLADLRTWHAALDPSWSAGSTLVERLTAAAQQAEVEADFNRLFSGALECPPHETAYEPDIFRRQRALADIAGFYRAFRFGLDDASRWQPDHIGVELEFCAIALQRGASAAEHGWSEPAQVCDRALRAFLTDHLGRWFDAFAGRMARRADTGLYRALAELTRAWLRSEIDRLALRPQPLADRPRTLADDAAPACGGCPVVSDGQQSPQG